MTNTVAIGMITLLLDKADAPYFTDAEIQTFIELATHDFVEQNYKRFETTQESRDNLAPLVVVDTSSITSATTALPSGYRHFLSAKATISSVDTMLKMYQLDDLNAVINDPFNKPTDTDPICTIEGGNLVVHSTTAPAGGTFKYLKNPTMNTTAGNEINDLPSHTHYDIVNAAARKLLANIEDVEARYQAHTGESLASKQ